MQFQGKNLWERLKRTGAAAFVFILLLCPICVNAQEWEMIGTFGRDDYGPAAMDIVRHTTFNEDGTVSVSFDLKEEMPIDMFSFFVLRFRYDTEKMSLASSAIGTVDGYTSGSLGFIPYSFISTDFWMQPTLPAETICTLTFRVNDTSDSTDVFGVVRPYYWVDLGGEDTRNGNPVTVYMDGNFGYYKVNLYEGKEVCAHTNTTSINVVEPLCTEEGSYDTFCNTCRKMIRTGDVIAALGHNYGAWQPHDEKLHTRICGNDSSHVENGEHRFGEWKIVTEATETAEGSREKCCADCGYILTEKIDKLEKPTDPDNPTDPTDPDNPTDPTDPGKPADPDNPDTGDPSLLLLWSILCILSLSGVIIGYRNRRM